ncbi:glutathione S-transferase N-terminal domain-containing protein [Roseococcus sp. SDR]|uniref:glutathione S-transferase N-terminal domain-containing protein n=1 Tax=Roseococcus sp. SDR TaxID=2835532 RepID=UPI001BCE047E|nr:glutathione S-transferase N-terminal domain-containing protein [Roseococcus sp. SDR]MBS7792897.1 glutathione S-transferase N-terminal domain-containing protein [Roseococcus sp. SDR]MBV1848211.1 glutathione S-transferase N-terminal domain-containing protein [Roseococcus sp. SDR]
MYTLISATPSPYARKVRIALLEKGIPFTLQTEVPWHGTTATPAYNPLEKLPVLVQPDGTGIYESRFILEWLEVKHPTPRLLPDDPEAILAARQVEVLADGVCDAVVLLFFERMRAAPSEEWIARQRRKVEGGVRALAERAEDGFLVGNRFGLADIAAGTALRYLAVRFPEFDWAGQYPNLAAMSARLEARPSFAATVPVPQTITEKVV